MSLTTALATYFILWWLVLFIVLPFGIRSQHETGDVVPGSEPGAPAIPRLGLRLLWTTGIAAVIFAGMYFAYVNRLVSIEDLATLWGLLG